MVGGAWLANAPGLKGAIYHVVADAAMTSAIFMVIGCIIYRLGQAELKKLDGLFYKMPVTFIALVITMAALIGVPPTCGFFSKFYLIEGAAQAGTWHFVIALLISSLVKAIILFRIIEIGYNQVPNPAKEGNKAIPREEAPLTMLIPTAVVALGLIALGLATDTLVTDFIARPCRRSHLVGHGRTSSTIPLWIVLISSMAAVGITLCGRIPNLRESIIFLAAGLKLTLLLSSLLKFWAGKHLPLRPLSYFRVLAFPSTSMPQDSCSRWSLCRCGFR